MKTVSTIRAVLAAYSFFVVITACAPAAQYAATKAATVVDRIHPDSSPPALSEAEVRAAVVILLDSGASAWNRGDLEGFMRDYARGTATTFVTSKGVLRGPEAIQQMYAPRFAPGGTRDSLSFENVEVDVLGTDALHVLAYYRLMRGDSTVARGPTSLIMRWLDGRWQIRHDHSS